MRNVAQHIVEKTAAALEISERDAVVIVAEMAETHWTTVYRWIRPADQGGHDGEVPRKRRQIILDSADSFGVELSRDDFNPNTIEETQA